MSAAAEWAAEGASAAEWAAGQAEAERVAERARATERASVAEPGSYKRQADELIRILTAVSVT